MRPHTHRKHRHTNITPTHIPQISTQRPQTPHTTHTQRSHKYTTDNETQTTHSTPCTYSMDENTHHRDPSINHKMHTKTIGTYSPTCTHRYTHSTETSPRDLVSPFPLKPPYLSSFHHIHHLIHSSTPAANHFSPFQF